MNPTPSFSVIVCSIDAGKFAQISAAYRRLLAGHRCEIIGIHDAASLAAGYNRGIQQASGDILIFSHDDILILDPDFAAKVVHRLTHFDLLGFAGASKLVSDLWAGADLPFLHGVIAHAPAQSRQITLDVFGALQWPVAGEIKAIDGLCMIARADVARQVGFDAVTFDGFHLYDLDFSFAAYRAGYRIGVCCDIPLIHHSAGKFDSRQQHYADRFLEKHGPCLDSQEFARPPGHTWTTAAFADDQALLRTWQENTLQRSSIAIFRKAGLPVPPAVASLPETPHAVQAAERDEEADDAPTTAPAPIPESPPDEAYRNWLAARSLDPVDLQQLAPRAGEAAWPSFQILLRLPAGAEAHLADTLDSLGEQYLDAWRLDIVTPLPAPDGLAELPNIGWHEVAAGQPVAMAALVEAAAADWVLEIPPGARLDPLYLWRIATEAARSPAIQAFFVDDDCTDPAGQRQAPRFKPGCNPSRLLAGDLAGPLCVRRPAYLASAAGAPPAGSPWFRQLLAIAEQHGWASIGHVADVLLTYPQAFPSDTAACLHALLDFLGRQAPGAEIVPVTGQAWNIRYSLPSPAPKVCIALLSQGQLDLLARCLNTILKLTHYPDFEVLLVVDPKTGDNELDDWLSTDAPAAAPGRIRVLRPSPQGNHAARGNLAMAASDADYVVLLREEAAIVQEQWLDELLRPLLQPAVAAVAPLLITPGKAEIWAAGCVLGLMGSRGYPEQQKITLGQPGYLEHASAPRDTSTLSSGCVLWRRADYLEAGGMDETLFGDHLADADLFLKLRDKQRRLLFQPASVVVFNGPESPTLDYDPAYKAQAAIAGEEAAHELNARWGRPAAVDPLWNPNLSLTTYSPLPETKFRAQWQFLPSDRPRIFACPIPNGQGDYRITSPLKAARKLGLASQCVWMQSTKNPNYLTVPELLRLAPDTAIVQNYIFDRPLAALDRWHRTPGRPFTVYALDDLITGLDPSNPFFKNIPANARARLQYALDRCDRMVVSTEFLADRYSSFIGDIRIAPNCLEQEIWLPLRSQKRTGKRPRIGWAGGSTHHADLLLLREIIERTRHEADWVFFGMCPRDVLPLLAEFHDTIAFEDYPAYLAALNFDIAVAPLAQTEFNRGKSNLRLLEYGILGIPVVCTDIDPYRDSPACRVANTVDAWVEALRARIHDADAREREGVAMRDWVCQNYLLENRVNDWLAAHLPD